MAILGIKLNSDLSDDTGIPFQGVHFREIKTYVPTKMCGQMFIEALFFF